MGSTIQYLDEKELPVEYNEQPLFMRCYEHSITVLSRYNEVGYSEQLDIVNTFRLFGWLSVELMIENSGYSELGYNEYLVITNAFSQIFRFFHSI